MKEIILNNILSVCLLATVLSCSNTKFLAENETLYTGTDKVEIIPQGQHKKLKSVKSSIYWSAYQKPNNSFYTSRRVLPPVRLWIYNYMQTEKKKGLKSWMHRSFSEEPLLIDDLNLDQRVKMLESQLFNEGFFGARVNYELKYKKSNPKKARVKYHVLLPQAYKIDSLSYQRIDKISSSIQDKFYTESLIKKGDNYSLNTILSERERISTILRNEGYYAFNREYLEFKLDTSLRKKAINVSVGLKKQIPDVAAKKYFIQDIVVNLKNDPNDSLLISGMDTLKDEDFTFIYDKLFVNTSVIKKAIYQVPGEKFTQTHHDYTFNHLGNLGVFQQINLSYDTSPDSNDRLNMNILLTSSDKVSLSGEVNVVSKSTGFLGPAIVGRMTHQNLFGGAEKLDLSINAGYEWQILNSTNSGLGFNSYELGIKTSLSFPKVIAPFGLNKITNAYVPKTIFSAGFDLMNRVQYYKMISLNASYKYQWKGSLYNQNSFSLLDVNYVDLVDTTAAFSEIYLDNQSVRRSFEEQFIVSMRYRFSYDNSTNKKRVHQFFTESGIATAGNFLNFIDKKVVKNPEDETGTFFGKPYAQFLKISEDFRYYYNSGRKSVIVNRLYVGFGFPYGNSTVMPYVEQFFSGGANSIRGFVARSLGPGDYRGDTLTYFDQTGDIKLEYNFEYRFRIGKKLFGATFLDVGNIWLRDEDPLRPGSGFNFNTFYKQLAFGTGFGIRFDIDFFVFRFDIGVPLRNPGYDKGNKWVFENPDIFKLTGFIAIGYPF